ncbi:MAG: fumarylacetoacetase [Pyrinomonadaceae bacterium]|nr:fumarylacetoacetase [Pyrinomonadaceae bacterium]
MINVNETHDPNLKSWIESANAPDTDFPIQNLPFCLFYHPDGDKHPIEGVIIGDYILELINILQPLKNGNLIEDNDFREWMLQNTINRRIIFTDNAKISQLRKYLIELLREDCPKEKREILQKGLHPISQIGFAVPAEIGDYTDFYCSIFHATNVGAMFRPDNPLLPNYKYIPIGYHGRASSIVVSGTDVKRPKGQNRTDADAPPVYIPAKNLDYEMEVGFFVGKGNEMGETIPIENAEEHVFGLCLVNDWSARDIQAWEYQPLGPFLAKSFATTVSPFIVTMEALAPFRVPAFERDVGDPQPLDYLNGETNRNSGGFDIKLEVYLQTTKMRDENEAPFLLSRSNTKDLYWTIGQMLTHHASNGCNLQTGDLMATGTVSGREKDERGCLLELTWRGKEPINLPNGEERRFLEDGDEIIMKGFCEREGFRRIGFGTCRGRILPAA